MHDQVADILAERSALERSAAGGVMLSLFLHGTAAALVVYTATHRPPPKAASLINIRLTSPAPAPVPAPASASEKAPRIEPPKPAPIKPAVTPKPVEKNTVPISPFGKSPKKGSESPEPPKPTPPAPQPVAPVVPVGGTGVTGIEGDFPYTLYIERMRTLVGSHWFRPQGASTEAGTTIYFFINRDGSIRDAKIETSSGNTTFDRAALRAVLETSPLPPLPFGYSGTYLGVHLSFR